MPTIPLTPAEQDAARSVAQARLRQRAVQIADGIAGTSMIGLLAAGAAFPFFASTNDLLPLGAAIASLGGNALASWLVEWAKQRMQAAGALAPEMTLGDLARALDVQQQADVQISADVERLLSNTQAVATLLDALSGQAERQTKLLQLLTEDLQQATFRNERLHEATYQEVIQLRHAVTQGHAELEKLVAAILAAPPVPITNTAPNSGAQGVFHAPVNINHTLNLPPRPAPPPAFQVPYPQNPLFVGRDAQLDELEQLLTTGSSAILTPVIAGMGGVGKTQLASEFAHAQRSAFPGGVFWLNMEQPKTIATQIAACAGPGGLDLEGYDSFTADERREQVKAAWAQAEPRRLVVFDNLEDPKILNQWRPFVGSSRLLITSRRDDWPAQIKRVRLKELARPASRTLLLRPRAEDAGRGVAIMLTDPETCTDADAICDALGDLPLALAVAGVYLKLSPSTTLHAYSERLKANPLADEQRTSAIMADVLAEAGLPTGRERGIITTFAISYEQLNADVSIDTLALTMLHAAAYCASAPIPQAVLLWVGDVAEADLETVERRDVAIRRLRATGLVAIDAEPAPRASDPTKADDEPPLVVMHRLIAAYLRSLMIGEEIQRGLCVALTTAGNAAVNSGIPRQSAPLLVHLLHAELTLLAKAEALHAALLNTLGRVQRQQLDYTGARSSYERALVIVEQVLGPTHPDTAQSLNNLGGLLHAQGNLSQARLLYERALAIREQVLGPVHPETAQGLNNLAGLLHAQGDLAQARLLYERALAIREQALGPTHPDTAQSLNNLGGLLHAQGNLSQARLLYERALAIREQVLGPVHLEIAQGLNNLGGLLHAQGNLSQARLLYERALAIREQVLGPVHPETAQGLNNLAGLLHAQGDLAQARLLYERALAIREQVLGPVHPEIAQGLNNLAGLLHAQGDLAQARLLYERALAIREQVLGPVHPEIAQGLNNLAGLLHAQGDLAQARLLYERALAIREQVLGPVHPETAQGLNNLAGLLHAQGDLAQARLLYERALAIREQVLGPVHLETAQGLNNLAGLLHAQGDLAQARLLYERALAIREQVLGSIHPETAQGLNNLAGLLHAQGDLAQARLLYERALAIREQVLGPVHPETAQGLNNLGSLLHAQGDLAGACPYYERALAITEQVLGPNHPDTARVRENYQRLVQQLRDQPA